MATTNVSLEHGSPFAMDYRSLLWAVDTLEGDDPQDDSITAHGVVDADDGKLEQDPPDVYKDKKAGMDNVALNRKHGLLELPAKLIGQIDASNADELRKGVLKREIAVCDLRLQCTLAGEVDGVTKPTFHQLWKAITDQNPPPFSSFNDEIDGLRGQVKDLLARVGYNVNPKKPGSLRSVLTNWEHGLKHYGVNDSAHIKTLIKGEVEKFMSRFKVFGRNVPAMHPFLDQFSMDGYNANVLPDMSFDAGSSFIGGPGSDGRSSGKVNFEWNAGRAAPFEDIVYISWHEATHWLNAHLMAMRRRLGLLGPEAALLTMSTPRAVNEEGLAQTLLEMMHGGLEGVIADLGVNMGIILLLDRLQDIARMVAAIAWNEDLHIDPAPRRLAIWGLINDRLLQPDQIAYKYAGQEKPFWRSTPGGNMYAPAYYYGSRAYRQAYQTYGVEKTVAVGMHLEGLVDIHAFDKKVAE